MNHGKHVIPKEFSIFVNLLPKYLEGKIKVSTSVIFLRKFASGFGLVEHVRHHRIFTSYSKATVQSLVGHVRPW
jgi:hypothetical protein